jgi:UDP-N-acetylmuramoyl-tripeptide--D-alanyl-D-alanine ligase
MNGYVENDSFAFGTDPNNETASTFDYNNMTYEVNVPGEHFVLNALAAISVGECLNIPYEKMKDAIANFELTKNRMDFVELKNNISIIDGTYNANLDSMLSSLAVLGKYERRKIAVLADMLELGEYSEELHLKTGKAVDENNIDVLICVGNESKYIIEGAQNTKDKHWFQTNDEAYTYLKSILQEKDILLVKGSNSMRLKEIITKLKEND